MKNLVLLTVLALNSLFVYSQLSQSGLAREINSGKKPLDGVFIKFESAPSTNTDEGGKFQLTFQDKKIGDLIFLEDIRKSGYELVNRKDFEVTKISNNSYLGVDVILAKAGYVDAAKKEYYDVSDKALLVSFEREKRTLRKQLADAELNQTLYMDQIKTLRESYETQKANLDRLSEKFARVNFDDVEPLYEEALKLFKAGQIDSCLSLLEGADLLAKTQKELQRKDMLEEEIEQINTALKQAIGPMQLQAQLYVLRFNYTEAESLYDQLLLIDSTDLGILEEAAGFFIGNYRSQKAMLLYPQIIIHPEAKPWQIAKAQEYMGELYTRTGKIGEALQSYMDCSSGYLKLSAQHDNPIYLQYLAGAFEQLGYTYFLFGKSDSAITYYQKSIDIVESVRATDSLSVSLEHVLASTFQKLGYVYNSLGDLDSTMRNYQKAIGVYEQLRMKDPRNVPIKKGLISVYQLKGYAHSALGELDSALNNYIEALTISKQILAGDPQNIDIQVAMGSSCQFLGFAYETIGILDSALHYYKGFHSVMKYAAEFDSPNGYFKRGLAISYQHLGLTYTSLGKLDSALHYHLKEFEISQQLASVNLKNTSSQQRLALSQESVGRIYEKVGELDSALHFFQASHQIMKGLKETHSENASFQKSFAISCQHLGKTYLAFDQLDSSLHYFRIFQFGMDQLVNMDPQNSSFQELLFISYENLGHFFVYSDQADSAVISYKKSLGISEQLVKKDSQNAIFIQNLSKSNEGLGLAFKAVGNLDSALHYYQKSLQLDHKLQEIEPENVIFQNGMATTIYGLGSVFEAKLEAELALQNYKLAFTIWDNLLVKTPDNMKYQQYLIEAKKAIQRLENQDKDAARRKKGKD